MCQRCDSFLTDSLPPVYPVTFMVFSGSPLSWQRLSWETIRSTDAFQGCWVALDQCRYEDGRPSEGTVVDFDPDLAALCDRMREADSRHCAIVFCDAEETPMPSSRPPAGRLTPIPQRGLRH